MRSVYIVFLAIFLFVGCAGKNKEIDELITKEEHIRLSTACVQDVFVQKRDKRKIFDRFPFLASKQQEIRGKFSDEFYESLNLVYTARNIKDVDYWELDKNPETLDFIYVKPLWIKQYRKLGSDLFENIAYSYNISKKEQDILKRWIADGGKLWVEFGTYSTKYDVFNKYGEISTKNIVHLIKNSFSGVRFLDRPVYSYVFRSKNLDFINYVPSSKTFVIDRKRSVFKDIGRLKIDLNNYMENYIVVAGKPLILDRDGKTLVSEIEYGKGSIVTLLPFEFSDVYYDGERLRWELLFYLYDKK